MEGSRERLLGAVATGAAGRHTRNSDSRDVTLLDLVHATRHGRIPVVPPHGGYLSIGQWYRIFGLARSPDRLLPSHVAEHTATSLGIDEIATDPSKIRNSNAHFVAIGP